MTHRSVYQVLKNIRRWCAVLYGRIHSLADLDVQEVVDYEPGVNGLPPANVIQFNLEGSNKIVVRPSGTEPKIKVYVFAKQATRQLAEELLAQLEEASSQLLSAD